MHDLPYRSYKKNKKLKCKYIYMGTCGFFHFFNQSEHSIFRCRILIGPYAWYYMLKTNKAKSLTVIDREVWFAAIKR